MDLRASSLGFYRVWFAALGQRHGFLEALAVRPRTPAQLAKPCGLERGPVAKWCRGAEALEIVTRTPEGAYRLRPEHHATLGDSASPNSLAHQFEYLARKSLTFDDLSDMLRGVLKPRNQSKTYALATKWDHVAFFDVFLPRERALRAALTRGIDVLDLGCGEGGWAIAAANRFPRSRFVASDADAGVLRRARAAFRKAELGIRAMRSPPGEAFDLVFLGEVLTSPTGPTGVLRAARRALRQNGRLVALEGLLPPTTRQPSGWGERLILAMDFDFGLDGSAFLEKDEALRALHLGGFSRVRARDLGGSLFALTATRAT